MHIQFFKDTMYYWIIGAYSGIYPKSYDSRTANCSFTLRKVLYVQLLCLLFRKGDGQELVSVDNLCPSQTDI